MIDVSVIIVNWNSKAYLRKCLASIRSQNEEIALEIVVIDSGSFDGSAEMVQAEFPEVLFQQSAVNSGFAAANNAASDMAQGDALLFLNPDTELLEPAIGPMYRSLCYLPDAGVVGCGLLNSDGTRQSSSILGFPTIANQVLNAEVVRGLLRGAGLWRDQPLSVSASGAQRVEAVSGACMMVRRKAFDSVGQFSEDYFMYAEDVDLAYKMAAAGYANYHLPTINVVHHGGRSSDQASNLFAAVMTREALWRFFRKTRGSRYAKGFRLATAAAAVLRLSIAGTVAACRPRSVRWRSVRDKWWAVLVWSIGRDRHVGHFYSDVPPSTVGGGGPL